MQQLDSAVPGLFSPEEKRTPRTRKVEYCQMNRKKRPSRNRGHFDQGHALSLSLEGGQETAFAQSVDRTEEELTFAPAEAFSGETGMNQLMEHSSTRNGTTTKRSIRSGKAGTEYRKSKVSASEDQNPEGSVAGLKEKDGEFDMDFEEDLEKILAPLNKEKEEEEESPTEEQSQAQSLPNQAPREKVPEGHNIFEKMATGMEYATTFDMGTVDLSQAFDQFDSAMEVKEMTGPPLKKKGDQGTEEMAEMFSQFDSDRDNQEAEEVEAEEISSAQSRQEMQEEALQLDLRPPFPKNGPKRTGASGEYDPDTGSYSLKKDDTLYSIAIRFGTDVPTLMEENGITNPANLPDSGTIQIVFPRYGTMDWRKALELKEPEKVVIDIDSMDSKSLAKAQIDLNMSIVDNRLAALSNFETVLTSASLKESKQKGLGAIALAEGSKLMVEYLTGRISSELKETVKFLRNTANSWEKEKKRAREALSSYNLRGFIVSLRDDLTDIKTALRNDRELAGTIANQEYEAKDKAGKEAYLANQKQQYQITKNDFNGYYSIPVQFQYLAEDWVRLWYQKGKTIGLAHILIDKDWRVTTCDLKVPGGQKLAEQLMEYSRQDNGGAFDLASFQVERQLAFYSGHYVWVNPYGTAYKMAHHGFAHREEWSRIANDLQSTGIPSTRVMSGSK